MKTFLSWRGKHFFEIMQFFYICGKITERIGKDPRLPGSHKSLVQVKGSWVTLLDLQRHEQRLMMDTGYVGGQNKIFAVKDA